MQFPQQPTSFFNELKRLVSPANGEILDRFLARPEVQKVVFQEEEERLAVRAAKVKRLSNVEAEFQAPLAAAAKRMAAVEKRERTMEIERLAIQTEKAAAYTEQSSLSVQITNTIGQLERELLADADPRLEVAIECLTTLLVNRVRHADRQGVTGVERNPFSGINRSIIWTNISDVRRAWDAVQAGIEECQRMRGEAISSHDVEARLSAIFKSVAVALAPIDVHTTLQMVDGAVVAPA